MEDTADAAAVQLQFRRRKRRSRTRGGTTVAPANLRVRQVRRILAPGETMRTPPGAGWSDKGEVMATQPATVEYLLGVPARIGGTRLGLADSIVSGLPVSALDHLADGGRHPTTTASNSVSSQSDTRSAQEVGITAADQRRGRSARTNCPRSSASRWMSTRTRVRFASSSAGLTRCSTAKRHST